MSEKETVSKSASFFSERQRSLIAGALALVAATAIAVVVVVALRGVFSFVGAHQSVLVPPIAAVLLALVLRPACNRVARWFGEKHKWARPLAVTLVVAAILVPILLFAFFFGRLALTQIGELVQRLPELLKNLWTEILTRAPAVRDALVRVNLLETVQNTISGVSDQPMLKDVSVLLGGTAISAVVVARDFFVSLIGWVALPVYTALLLCMEPVDGAVLAKPADVLGKRWAKNVQYLVEQFLEIIVAFFRGQILVALLDAACFGIAFWLVGLPYGLILGITLGLLNVVPYLGNILGLSVLLPLAMFGPSGSVALFVRVVIAFAVVHMLDSYLFFPRVMGKNVKGMNSFLVIFSIFFWGSVMPGVLGLLLAIPLTAFLLVLWRLVRKALTEPEA